MAFLGRDTDSIISFILLGLGVYFVYLVAKSVYKALKFTEKFAKEKIPKIESPKKEKPEREEKEDKKENKKREKELEKREKELSKREQEVRWASAVQKNKGKKDWTREYHTLEDSKVKTKDEDTIDVSRSPITPLPVIEHKEKKKRKKVE